MTQIAKIFKCNRTTIARQLERLGLYESPQKMANKKKKAIVDLPVVKTRWAGFNPFYQEFVDVN